MSQQETDRIAVLGYGVTGRSVARHLVQSGLTTTVLDTRPQLEDADLLSNVRYFWSVAEWPLLDVDRLVVSPGLPLDNCIVKQAVARGIEIVSDIDLFFEDVDAPVIGITGTNGKSTVTSMAAHILQGCGLECPAGGNLGEAALELLNEEADAYSLELSSFQLERSGLKSFKAAAILNVTEDHLDHHASMSAYIESKQRIYADAELCVFNRDDPATSPPDGKRAISFGVSPPGSDSEWGVSDDWIVRGDERIVACSDLPLPGSHNVLNAMAALALVSDLVAPAEAGRALAGFDGLAHRFELVLEQDGVRYIDDSKATNLGSAIAALEGFPRDDSVVLIAGGDAKGVDLEPLGDVMRGRVKHLIAIGQDGPQLLQVAAAAGVNAESCDSMAQAVSAGVAVVLPGDTLLLSPACASLDMFENYAQRGAQFAQAVRDSAGSEGER